MLGPCLFANPLDPYTRSCGMFKSPESEPNKIFSSESEGRDSCTFLVP